MQGGGGGGGSLVLRGFWGSGFRALVLGFSFSGGSRSGIWTREFVGDQASSGGL